MASGAAHPDRRRVTTTPRATQYAPAGEGTSTAASLLQRSWTRRMTPDTTTPLAIASAGGEDFAEPVGP
jgi:hypothetical protein